MVLASFKRLIREHNIANRNKHLAEHSGELPPQPASSAQATAQSKPAKTPPKANSGEAETSQTAKGAPQASSAPAPAASTGSSAATEHASAATSSAIHRPRRDPRALPDIFQFYIKNTAASLREPVRDVAGRLVEAPGRTIQAKRPTLVFQCASRSLPLLWSCLLCLSISCPNRGSKSHASSPQLPFATWSSITRAQTICTSSRYRKPPAEPRASSSGRQVGSRLRKHENLFIASSG